MPNARSQRFTPVLSSKSFIVVTLTFRPVINFELTFCVYAVRNGSTFILLHAVSNGLR